MISSVRSGCRRGGRPSCCDRPAPCRVPGGAAEAPPLVRGAAPPVWPGVHCRPAAAVERHLIDVLAESGGLQCVCLESWVVHLPLQPSQQQHADTTRAVCSQLAKVDPALHDPAALKAALTALLQQLENEGSPPEPEPELAALPARRRSSTASSIASSAVKETAMTSCNDFCRVAICYQHSHSGL